MTAEPALEPVPTMTDLALKGLAFEAKRTYVDAHGKVRSELRYTPTPAGQQLIYDAMHRNAVRGREHDEQGRVRA